MGGRRIEEGTAEMARHQEELMELRRNVKGFEEELDVAKRGQAKVGRDVGKVEREMCLSCSTKGRMILTTLSKSPSLPWPSYFCFTRQPQRSYFEDYLYLADWSLTTP